MLRPIIDRRLARTAAVPFALVLAATSAWAVPDGWITAKTKIELLTTDGVSGTDVDVDTRDGTVTLHGPVASEEAKALAERSARSIDGVRDVRNLLVVVPPGEREATEASDEAVRERLESALRSDPHLADVEIASVTDGTVVLEGSVDFLDAHAKALRTARTVEGVRSVESRIESPDSVGDRELREREGDDEPDAPAERSVSDAWLTTKVKLALVGSDEVSALDINVDTSGAAVTLFGRVPTPEAKTAAERVASGVEGVERVENDLEVVPEEAEEAVARGDEAIADAIEQRLADRDDLAAKEVDVGVAEGVVRLTGTISETVDRIGIIDVARSTTGVRRVIDDLTVEN